jgi:hypothetical protein
MAKGKIELHISRPKSDVAYVSLPAHPGLASYGIVKKQIRFLELYPDYKGPDLFLDLDKDNCLIGIEILA